MLKRIVQRSLPLRLLCDADCSHQVLRVEDSVHFSYFKETASYLKKCFLTYSCSFNVSSCYLDPSDYVLWRSKCASRRKRKLLISSVKHRITDDAEIINNIKKRSNNVDNSLKWSIKHITKTLVDCRLDTYCADWCYNCYFIDIHNL